MLIFKFNYKIAIFSAAINCCSVSGYEMSKKDSPAPSKKDSPAPSKKDSPAPSKKDLFILRFEITDKNMNIATLFEDQNLTDMEKEDIISDYQATLKGLFPKKKIPLKEYLINIDKKTVKINSAFYFGEELYWECPNALEGQFCIIGSSDDNKEYVVVPKKLSDNYKIAFQQKDSKLKKAFDDLPSFVASINDINGKDLTSIRNLFYFPDIKRPEDKSIIGLKNSIKEYECSQCSIFDFKIDKSHADMLFAVMYITNKKTGHREGKIDIIYNKDKWKMVIPDYE